MERKLPRNVAQLTGVPTTNPLLQAAKIDLHPKTQGLPTKSSTLGLLDAVSAEGAVRRTSTDQVGTVA